MEADQQKFVYATGVILGILVCIGYWQEETLGLNMGLVALGTIFLGFLILNYVLFRKKLNRQLVAGYGIVALITAFWGTYTTYHLIPSIVYGVAIVAVMLYIYLHSE